MNVEKNKQMARQIAEKVAAVGGRTYFVGGYVRDQMLNRENKDIDIEIHGIAPQTLMGILDELGERTVMGASFGIFGLKHYDLDISMPCRASEHSRGKQDFCDFADPFVGTEAAARRRDLTMNALMQDVVTGEILDYFGGMEDLRKGVLRHVDANSFREDPLRVFRVAQFAARLEYSVAEETVALCRTMDVTKLARERVFGELEKALLQSPRPSVFFQNLRQMGQLSLWFGEAEALIGVEQDPVHHPEGDVWNHTMAVLDAAARYRDQAQNPLGLMLAALCHDFGKVSTTQIENGRIRALGHEEAGMPLAEAWLSRLTNEVRLHRYVENMVLLHMRPNMLAAQRAKAKAMCTLFDRSVCPEDLLLLAKADYFGKKGACDYEETEQFLRDAVTMFRERMAQPYVKGADLVEAGFQPGTAFKEALAYAHKMRLAGVRKEDALKQTVAYLKKQIQ